MKNGIAILSIALFLAACSSKDKDIEDPAAKLAEQTRDKVDQIMSDDAPQNLEDALKRVGDVLSDGQRSVSAAELKTLLPDEMGGLKRTSYDAERTGFGVKVSKARAEYGDGDKRMSLMITDLGGVSGLAKMGMELFETEVDKENENGFEKTTTYKGHKAFQRMLRSGDQSIGEIMVFVADRFTVHLDGQNVPFDKLIESMDQVDLDALMAMKETTTDSN